MGRPSDHNEVSDDMTWLLEARDWATTRDWEAIDNSGRKFRHQWPHPTRFGGDTLDVVLDDNHLIESITATFQGDLVEQHVVDLRSALPEDFEFPSLPTCSYKQFGTYL